MKLEMQFGHCKFVASWYGQVLNSLQDADLIKHIRKVPEVVILKLEGNDKIC